LISSEETGGARSALLEASGAGAVTSWAGLTRGLADVLLVLAEAAGLALESGCTRGVAEGSRGARRAESDTSGVGVSADRADVAAGQTGAVGEFAFGAGSAGNLSLASIEETSSAFSAQRLAGGTGVATLIARQTEVSSGLVDKETGGAVGAEDSRSSHIVE